MAQKPKGNERCVIYMPAEVWEDIKRLADKHRLPRGEIVAEIWRARTVLIRHHTEEDPPDEENR